MIYFLEYSDWDLALEHFAEKLAINFKSVLETGLAPNLNKVKLLTWSTVSSDLAESENLFQENTSELTLVDIESLSLRKEDEKYLADLPSRKNIYFVRAAGVGLSAEEKKIWKSLKFEYITLKSYELATKTTLLSQYLSEYSLEISKSIQSSLLTKTASYTQLLNVLELIYLSGKPEEVIAGYFAEENLPIFMLPFSIGKLSSQAKTWYQRISEDEIQLGLSVVYGKLEKQDDPTAKALQQELITTDRNIKTQSHISANTFWKLFLWKAKEI